MLLLVYQISDESIVQLLNFIKQIKLWTLPGNMGSHPQKKNYSFSPKFKQHGPFFSEIEKETLPKALRTQALTALTSNLGLVGLVQNAW